jgi:hypothetical protein
MRSRSSTGFTSASRPGGAVEDRVQLFALGETHVQLEEEAVELRLGQRIRALALQRVLRGEHEERLVERT